MEDQPLISVIVPVYNVEKYLETCVSSIINQTYKNLEIILIDDGSTDSSPVLCDKLAKQDSRIKVIHKENGGLSSARNTGLESLNGEYVSFIDSDDYIAEDMYESLYKIIKENNLDLVKCNFTRFTDANNVDDYSDDTEEVKFFTNETAILNMLTAPYSRKKSFNISVCNALYKNEIIKNIFFPVGLLYEDGYYSPQVFLKAKKSAHIDKTFYFYRITENSIIKSGITAKSLKSVDDWEFIHDKIKEVFPQHAHIAAVRWVKSLIHYYDIILNDTSIDSDGYYRKHIEKKISENFKYFKASCNNRLETKKMKHLIRKPEKYIKKFHK